MPLRLEGLEVVLTGGFATLGRAEARALLSSAGARVVDSVSPGTDLVFYGGPGAGKLIEAEVLGVPAWSERAMLDALGVLPPVEVEGPLSDFAGRWGRMVGELRVDPRVHLLNAHLGLPASEEELDRIEARALAPLPLALRNLYRQANGATLAWCARGAENPGLLNGPLTPERVMELGVPMGGCVCLLPLEDLFSDDTPISWGDDAPTIRLGERELDASRFHAALRVFDSFSMQRVMAIWLERRTGEHEVVMGDEYGARFTHSRRTDVECYIKAILDTRGAVDVRRVMFQSDADGLARDRIIWPQPHTQF
ncbi:MAG: hypothetical protein H6739_17945 [Alphaproteobacteria bacterium]|nr:hypothetical protein [Alphaproteobacteria bacterium]